MNYVAMRDDVLALRGFNKPRVHGNGFIQLDLDDRRRLHVWGDRRIPRQAVSSPMHDHVFGFQSEVLVGRLVNVVHRVQHVEAHGCFALYQAQPNPLDAHDCKLARVLKSPDVVTITQYAQSLCAGQTYVMEPFVFHETFAPEPTATIMNKFGNTLAQAPKGKRPTVLVPLGTEPSNEFNRGSFDPEFLWTIIEDVLNGEGQN